MSPTVPTQNETHHDDASLRDLVTELRILNAQLTNVVTDHESRIRVIERRMYMAIGAAGLLGGGVSGIASLLVK